MKRTLLRLIALCMIAAGAAYMLLPTGPTPETRTSGHAEEMEKGPHNGRLLKDGDFAVELTIFEDGAPPQFLVYVYDEGNAVSPEHVQLSVETKRLDGENTVFSFTPTTDALVGNATVEEPHSFDVAVTATYAEQTHHWEFASYEGRTTIAKDAADMSGMKTHVAGPATIQESLSLTGRIMLNPNATAHVKARFPGLIRTVEKQLGDTVAADEVLATVESNDSLQVYPVIAPISGLVLSRNANVGEGTNDAPLFTIANLSTVWAEFHVFQRDMDKVSVGQQVHVRGVEGDMESTGTIDSLLPITEATSQTVVARVTVDNTNGYWRTGMTVRGNVIINEREAPLAVKSSALQRFRDSDVVFAQVGDVYEVRMLELGTNDGQWVEVLGGIKPGTTYVSENSFLIRADIEKSGASHDH